MTGAASQPTAKAFALPPSDNSVWFGFYRSGNYIFGARGTAGVAVIDISVKTAPVIVFESKTKDTVGADSSHACRTFFPVGTPGTGGAVAFSITRNGLYEAVNATSRIMEWDISDPDPANWGPSTPLVIYEDTSASANDVMLYSDMQTDGTNLFVAGQKKGVAKFSVSDVSAGPVTNEADDWETQGLVLGSSHAFYCNYRFGLRSILLSDMSSVDSIPTETFGGKGLRPWDGELTEDENHLIVSFNTSAPEHYSGIVVYDVSNPAAITHIATSIIPAEDRSSWFSGGDSPCLRTSMVDGYFFAANGFKGYGCWDVSDPTAPVWQGNISELDAGDSVAGVEIWQESGMWYAATGDGYQPANSGTNQFYLDRVYPTTPALPGGGKSPKLQRKSALTLSVENGNSSSWMTLQHGDVLYMAASTDGIRVFDNTDPTNPLQQANVRMKTPYIRGTHTEVDGNTLTDDTKSWVLTLTILLITSPKVGRWRCLVIPLQPQRVTA